MIRIHRDASMGEDLINITTAQRGWSQQLRPGNRKQHDGLGLLAKLAASGDFAAIGPAVKVSRVDASSFLILLKTFEKRIKTLSPSRLSLWHFQPRDWSASPGCLQEAINVNVPAEASFPGKLNIDTGDCLERCHTRHLPFSWFLRSHLWSWHIVVLHVLS